MFRSTAAHDDAGRLRVARFSGIIADVDEPLRPAEEVTRVEDPRSQAPSAAPSTSPGNTLDLPAARLLTAPTPARIGRFVIDRKLGEGGMGVVYYAFDPKLGRPVALKLLRPTTRTGRSDRGEARLLREAQSMARLSHPNVVQVFEVGEVEDAVYIAMEFVAGRDLRSWLALAPRGWREVVRVFLQAGRGLVAAHAARVVHRDFKPDNVLVGDDGRVRVLDFGLACPPRDPDPEHPPPPGRDALLTHDGAFIGTPAYMSPEQHLREPADARSDQFSFCVALYEALYGRRPFPGRDAAAIRLAVFRPLVQPGDRRVPAHLRRVLQRGLQLAPADRYPSMAALLAALAVDPARRRRRLGLGVATLALGVAGAVASGMLVDEQRCGHGADGLIGVWDRPRAEQARAAFLATGVAYARETWPKVQAEIDAYTRAWAQQRDEVCAATHVRGEASAELLDLRNACLDARLRELDALVGALLTADPATVEHAQQAVAGLAPLSRCVDDDFVRARVSPPGDPALADPVARARSLLTRAAAIRESGRPRESRDIAGAVVRSSLDLDYPPLRAEALLELGRGEESTADYELARGHLGEAYHLALGIAHDAVATDAAISLSLVYYRMNRASESFAWSEHARSLLQRTGEPPERRVWYLLYRSYAQTRLGLFVDAIASAREGLALAEASFPAGDSRIARLLAGVAHAVWAGGAPDDALILFERSQAVWRSGVGPDHPAVASAAINISTIYLGRHDYAEALAAVQPALAVMERAYGPEHPSVADCLINLAAVLIAQGRLHEAADSSERAARIYARRLGPGNATALDLLAQIGDLQSMMGQHDLALATLGRVLTLRQRAADDPTRLAQVLVQIADVLVELRRPDAAAAEYQRALDLLGRAAPPETREPALRGLARLARERGAPEQAEALARSALASDLAGSETTDRTGERAATLRELGEALLARGQVDAALDACQRSLVLEDMSFGPDGSRSAGALLCLGRAHRRAGQAGPAREALTRAVELLARSELAPQRRAEARGALAEHLRDSDPDRAAALAELAAADYRAAGPLFTSEAARLAAWGAPASAGAAHTP